MSRYVKDFSAFSRLTAGKKAWFSYFIEQAAHITCEVKQVSEEGDIAVVAAKCHLRDCGNYIQEVITDYFIETYAVSKNGGIVTEEISNEIIAKCMDKHRSKIKETMIERTINIKCIKENGKWLILSITPEIGNVLTSNFIEVMTVLRETMKEMLIVAEPGRLQKEEAKKIHQEQPVPIPSK